MVDPYRSERICLTTKHKKEEAISPPFSTILGAEIEVLALNTDLLGTFSGEVNRNGSALECARRKCAWGLESSHAYFGLANEGSFGPHPFIPFIPCDFEVLYFIDRKRDFHLYETLMSEKTNYKMGTVQTLAELRTFAEGVQFPSHALVLRPNEWKDKSDIVKGVQAEKDLEAALFQMIKRSPDGLVWVETDMRAHMNPTRMSVIKELTEKLARRLATLCPHCSCPGWGKVRVEKGLTCSWCGMQTDLVKHEIYGCVKCSYEETRSREDGLTHADPSQCSFCNP